MAYPNKHARKIAALQKLAMARLDRSIRGSDMGGDEIARADDRILVARERAVKAGVMHSDVRDVDDGAHHFGALVRAKGQKTDF